MSLLDSTAGGILLPEQVGPLIVQPLRQRSTAIQVATEIQTLSPTFRLPVVELDAASAWLTEGDDIVPTDPTIGEEVVRPTKVGALVKVSNELANDSSPAATAVVGDGLVRSIARKVDLAFFGNTTPNGPNGLLSLTDAQTVNAGGAFENFDWAVEAQSKLERVGSTVTAFCASFETVRLLSEIKTFQGDTITSNQTLLSDDQTQGAAGPTPRTIHGVPLRSLPEGTIADGIVWALDAAKVYAVIRSDIGVVVDPSFYFGSDSLACRVIMRIGYGFRTTLRCAKSAWLAVADRRSGLVSPSCTKPVQRPPAIPVIPCPLVGRCAAPQLAPWGGGLGPDSGDVTRWQQFKRSGGATVPI
jgi:HK97 family phage major capsid protein